jgi:type 1 glutamine amidotransferase
MLRVLKVILIFVVVWMLCDRSFARQSLKEKKIRVLVITGGHEFNSASFYALFEAISDVEISKAAYPEAADLLAPSLAERFDVIVFYDLWAKGISAEQQQAFVELLKSGIGIVALHHTLAAHQQWPEYEKIIGGKYLLQDRDVDGRKIKQSGYSHDQDIPVVITDRKHPITAGIEDFEIHDETYNGYQTSKSAQVLLTTNHPESDRAIAWVNHYQNSRVLYLQPGHDTPAFKHASYRELVARGIRWAAGRPADVKAPFVSLFNGKNLEGWSTQGKARWEVNNGILSGRQGDGNSPGDLFTNNAYDDFELTVTFKVDWPANTGVWYRYQSASQAFQADVLEYKKPLALTGSLYCTGKMFLTVNTDATLINREGWNTFVIRAAGNRHVIYLNGKLVSDTRDDTSFSGKIGFQVHAGDQFSKMRVRVKQIAIREL